MRRVVPVAGGCQVQVVFVPAAGERDVELLAGFAAVSTVWVVSTVVPWARWMVAA
jgi:hypothetical protein